MESSAIVFPSEGGGGGGGPASEDIIHRVPKDSRRMLCIIFDAFKTQYNDDYVPKKCSVYDITTGANICTYFIAPPYTWEQLNTVSRDVNTFLSRYIIGTDWYDGNITFDQFLMCLTKHSANASQIFTKGIQCQKYLAKILGRNVIDIEPLLKELHPDVVDRFKLQLPTVNCAYMDHTRRFVREGFQTQQYTCCQNRAFLYGNIVRYYLRHTSRVELKKQTDTPLPEHINSAVEETSS